MKGASNETLAHQCKQLLRLALAMRCFKGALELCKHVIDLKLGEEDFLYGPCMTGIVVTYARPFSGPAKDIGTLADRFGKFENGKLESIHKELIALRKKVFAHHDASGLEEFDVRNPRSLQAYVTTLEFGRDKLGKYYIRPDATVPQVTADSIPGYIDLLCFQMDRIEKATDHLIKRMAPADKKYKLGLYQAGVNFP